MINQAMIFAAGLGQRMRPLTTHTPKPLLYFKGKPLLYYALDVALAFKLQRIIINSHYLAPQINQAIEDFRNSESNLPEIIVTYEPTLLGSGGTVKSLGKYFSDKEAILTLNSDSIVEYTPELIDAMTNLWAPKDMDFLMLVHEANKVYGSKSYDFALHDNRLICQAEHLPYMYTGLQILSTEVVKNQVDEIFSLGRFYTHENQRRAGLINPGNFYHMSTPQDLATLPQ